MGQDDHLGVGQEGRSCWWWGCSSFYRGAGLCFTRVLGWAPSCSSGAVSPATVGGTRCHGGDHGFFRAMWIEAPGTCQAG